MTAPVRPLALVLAAALLFSRPAAAQQPPAGPGAERRAAAEDAVAVIDACLARLDPDVDVGFGRLARRCPDLAPRLEASGWAAWLPAGWKEPNNDLSAGSLVELRTLVVRELAVRRTGPAPRVERLEEVLVQIRGRAGERPGLWGRFTAWLRQVLTSREEPRDSGWLARMVSRIGLTQAMIELITYVALAIVVLLAGLILVNEVRLAHRARSVRTAAAAVAAASGGGHAALTPADIERLPPHERPGALLALVAERLTRLGRLPPAGSLTAREIVRAARLDEPDDRSRLAELSTAAEHLRYGQSAPAGLERGVARGRELLERLAAPLQGAAA